MNLSDLFPNLTDDNHEVTSPPTVQYNCIAWAACNTRRWWQPGVYWPIEASRDDHGIEECNDGSLEGGFEKLAIYGTSFMYTHAARQLSDGSWTSKLGQLEDITHATLEVIAGGDYGEVVQLLKRRVSVSPLQ